MKRMGVMVSVCVIVTVVGLYIWYAHASQTAHAQCILLIEQGNYQGAVEGLERIASRPLNPLASRSRKVAAMALRLLLDVYQSNADSTAATETAWRMIVMYRNASETTALLKCIESWAPEDAIQLANRLRDTGHAASCLDVLHAISRGHPSGEWSTVHLPKIAFVAHDIHEITEGDSVTLRAIVTSELDSYESLSVTWTSSVNGRLGETRPKSDGTVALSTSPLASSYDKDGHLSTTAEHLITAIATDSHGQQAHASLTLLVHPRVDVHVPVGQDNQGRLPIGGVSGTVTSTLARGPDGLTYEHLALESGATPHVVYRVRAGEKLDPGVYWIEVAVSVGGRRVETQRLSVDVFSPGMRASATQSLRPEVIIQNKSTRQIRIVLTGANPLQIDLPAGATRTLTLEPGQTCYVATAAGVDPAQGCHDFSPLTVYTWTWFIRSVYTEHRTTIPSIPNIPAMPTIPRPWRP